MHGFAYPRRGFRILGVVAQDQDGPVVVALVEGRRVGQDTLAGADAPVELIVILDGLRAGPGTPLPGRPITSERTRLPFRSPRVWINASLNPDLIFGSGVSLWSG